MDLKAELEEFQHKLAKFMKIFVWHPGPCPVNYKEACGCGMEKEYQYLVKEIERLIATYT